MSKIIARRTAASPNSGVFIYLLYLQNRKIKLTDMEFYVTGSITYTVDPVNVYFENLYVDTYQVIDGFFFGADCNYPEAYWTPTFYVNNFTSVILNDTAESFRPNVLYYSGPGNVTANNINISDTIGLVTLGLGTFMIAVETKCAPTDGLTKVINLDTVHTSLPDNPFNAYINMYVVLVGIDSSRPSQVNLTNVNLDKAYGSPMPYVVMDLRLSDTLWLSNLMGQNYNSISTSLVTAAGTIEFKNMTFQDVPSHPYSTILIGYSTNIVTEGIYFKNYTGSDSPVGHFISMPNNPVNSGRFAGITVQDSDLKNQKLMAFSTTNPVQSLVFERIEFTNLKYSSGSSFIQITSVKLLAISTLVFNNVSSSSSVDIDSASIVVSQVDLNFTGDIEISGVQYQNSSITLVSMPTFVNTPPTAKAINFRNMEFNNCTFVSQGSILRTEGIEYSLDLSLNFDNLSFSGISFSRRGNLLNLDQQLPTNLTISNSRFTNIQQGIISIASSNRENTALLTNVYLKNITASQIQQNGASFLNVLQGGRVHISDSSFTGMYTYQDGGILTGGSSSTITTIHNSTFQNNYALNGGVFNVKEQSIIKLYSCNITDNFAITSGVINVVSNGHFEIYDSYIYNNYANVNPVSQLLDTAKVSLISNTKIYSNHVFSKANLTLEFASCSLLCFINQNFIDYSNTHFQAEISEVPNEYQFQLIFASLSITAASEILNEPLVVDSFVSTLEVSDTVIKNFITEGVTIRGVSSTMTLNNLTVQEFTMNEQSDYIFDALDSTVSITNSTSLLFRIRSSAVTIQGLTYEAIRNAEELGIISA